MGSSKVVALAGEMTNAALTVVGQAVLASKGIECGKIVDEEAAGNVVCQVITALEKTIGKRLKSVYLVYREESVSGFRNRAELALGKYGVELNSIKTVVEIAQSKILDEQEVFLTHHLNGFEVDGERVSCALGREGEQLGVEFWSVVADRKSVLKNILLINKGGVTLEGCVPAGLGGCCVVTSDKEQTKGVLVLDIGAGTTCYTLYSEDRVVAIGVIPLGGNQLTGDLSFGFGIDFNEAEALKKLFGGCYLSDPCVDQYVILKDFEKWGKIKKKAVVEILQSRMEEIFEMIKKVLGIPVDRSQIPGGVVIVGGCARLHGIERLASQVFKNDVYCRESFVNTELTLKQPEYAAVLGTLFYTLQLMHQHPYEEDA
jgi:cell division protein FtsA